MFKKFPSEKINGTKNALFFIVFFTLRFIYDVQHKIRLSKTVCEIFHFRFHFIFIRVYFFVRQNP